MADGSVADIGFSNLSHGNSGLHTGFHAHRFQHIRQSQRIDGSCQHTHMVSAGSVEAVAHTSAEEVSAPDNNTDLHTDIDTFFDAFTDIANHSIIQTEFFFSGESFAAQFQKNSFVL